MKLNNKLPIWFILSIIIVFLASIILGFLLSGNENFLDNSKKIINGIFKNETVDEPIFGDAPFSISKYPIKGYNCVNVDNGMCGYNGPCYKCTKMAGCSISSKHYYLANGVGITISASGNVKNFSDNTIRNNGRACGSTFSKTFKATCRNETTATGTITVTAYNSWREVGIGYYKSCPGSSRSAMINQRGDYAYEYVGKENGLLKYKVYYRGCSSPSAPPSVNYNCYRKASNDIYDYKWASSQPSGYTKVTGIKTEKECVINNPNYCEASSVSKPISKNMTICSGKANFELQGVNECTVNSSDFYQITCNENIASEFKSDSQDNTIKIKAGQGFKYSVDLSIKKYCSGTFDVTKWNDAYNKATSLINRAKVTNDSKEVIYYTNIRNDIIAIAKNYNAWKSVNEHDYSAELKFTYKANGKNKNFVGNFEVSASTVKSEEIKNGVCQTLNNGTKVCNFDKQLVSTADVLLQAPRAYIDKTSSNVLEASTSNTIDVGNKFFTDYKADAGTYKATVVIAIDSNKTATITNDICNLTITKSSDIDYRIIDVDNPFINNSRVKGKNWSSDLFDFVNIIDDSVWQKSPLYIFNLSKSKIQEIKKSNERDPNAYLGTCHLSQNLQDSAIRDICDIINQK